MNAAQKEVWKPVVGWEDSYQVSNLGNLRSIDRVLIYKDGRKGFIKGKLKKVCVGNHGYPIASLTRSHRHKTVLVHRLVLEAFIGPCPSNMEACHANSDRTDNRLENLRWDTCSENQYDKGRVGVDHNRNKTHCPRGHLLTMPNIRGAEARMGHRTCLACDRAKSYIRRHPDLRNQFKLIADRKYKEIMS